MGWRDDEWGWQDYIALIVAFVWGFSYVAGLFVPGYSVPVEVTFAMLAVMGALGFKKPE